MKFATSEFFIDSSLHWRKNKRHLGNGIFVYKCNLCKKMVFNGSKFCKYHHHHYQRK